MSESMIYFFLFIFFAVGILTLLGVIYLSINRVANKTRKENMSKIDFEKEKDYYRDILKGYSPTELSYIDDFEVEFSREITATLLKLELKGKIQINEDEITLINRDLEGLKRTEIYIMNSIQNGKVQIKNEKDFYFLIQKEAWDDGLITKKSEEKSRKNIKKLVFKEITKIMILIILFFIYCSKIDLIFYLYGNTVGKVCTWIFILVCIALTCNIIGFYFKERVYSDMQMNSFCRTQKGEEINKKIEGLKVYIKDYSLLNESKKEELKIWEEYLIYSVIFDMNATGIVEKISKLILF